MQEDKSERKQFQDGHASKPPVAALTAVIIDDNRPDLNLQRLALLANGSFGEILEYNSPVRALEVFTKGTLFPDLILLDFRMPWMTGAEFIDAYERLMGSQKKRPHIVLYSAMSEAELKEHDLHSELILGVFPKPITLGHIEQIVEKIKSYR